MIRVKIKFILVKKKEYGKIKFLRNLKIVNVVCLSTMKI